MQLDAFATDRLLPLLNMTIQKIFLRTVDIKCNKDHCISGPFCVIIASLPMDFVKIATVYIILYAPMVGIALLIFYFYKSSEFFIKIEKKFGHKGQGRLKICTM